jgi:hypothetical protein
MEFRGSKGCNWAIHNQTNDENTQDVKYEDSDECLPGSIWNDLARVSRLGSGNGDDLDVAETERGCQEDFPESQ